MAAHIEGGGKAIGEGGLGGTAPPISGGSHGKERLDRERRRGEREKGRLLFGFGIRVRFLD